MSQLVDSSLAGQFDRLPPHAIEAEMCVIASMMLDKEIIGQVVQIIDREAFYQADHQILYDILVKLYEQNRAVDVVILVEELKRLKLYEEVGGKDYLVTLLSSVPSAAHAVYYANIVREKSLLRQLISASNEVLRDAYAPHEKADLVLDKAEKRIFEIAQKKVGGAISSLGDVAMEVYEMLEDKGRRGIESSFYELDDMLNGLQNGEMIIVAARPSMGKAQPLDARVLTPNGFKAMGDLAVGDELASVDGASSHVTGIYPQGERQVYRITLSDGRSTECCAEHLWRVHCRHWPAPRILSTAKIMQLLTRRRYQNRVWIENFAGEFGDQQTDQLPLDPWLLGALLGDGSMSGSSLRFSTASDELLAKVESSIGQTMAVTHTGNYDYRIIRRGGAKAPGVQGVLPNPIMQSLRTLGLWERDAATKFIPALYLRTSRPARLKLLAGLIDTDGWVESFGAIRLATVSIRLATDIVHLARSLGGSASFYPKATTYTYRDTPCAGQTCYVCNIQLPNVQELDLISAKAQRLPGRKRQRRLNIAAIVPTRITQTQCISVSHPSRLYVTDDYIVTHNTAFAMNIIEHVAADSKLPCAVFSLEMSKQQLAQRLMCSRAQIDAQKVRKGLLGAQEYQLLAQTVSELAKAPIWVDDSPGLTILELRAKARRLKLQHDIKLIMIDYMQLMDNPGPESRQQQISEISRGIKAVARELNVPVIALSQLNRQSEGRDGHRPRMSDLRESGSIEQDADVIMLLHREDYYRMQEPDFMPDNIAEVIIAKQRNGPTGTVKLTFDNKTTSFKNLAAQIDTF
ncbi:MAG TPA: replicative DNA helicase [Tepidisphaeraceae bacterium]|jgi:replicative DNA helicase|nr:replicative DNA helicase [Tepidisphaeraceae bacterium]